MNENNNSNNSNSFGFLDILSIISFIIQMKNIEADEKQTKYINDVILAISEEIKKLHEENDIIIKKIKELKEEKNGINAKTKRAD